MKERFTLTAIDVKPSVVLRAIAPADLEDLRLWKNANRAGFFFKGDITPEMQEKWHREYLERPHDLMFIAESGGLRAGCMGFRMREGAADCYNIIGAPEGRGKGILGAAMRLMCSYIKAEHTAQIGCQVLKDNPALDWYQKCGYRVAAEQADCYQMELDLARFEPCSYRKNGGAR